MRRILEPALAVLDEAAIIILAIALAILYLYDRGTISLAQAIAALLLVGAVTAFIIYKVVEAHSRRIAVGKESMIGKKGRVVEDLDPVGMVMVEGELWRARSAGGPIRRGSIVVVKSVEDLTLVVEEQE